MSARAPHNAKSPESSSDSDWAVEDVAPLRESGHTIKTWKRESSHSEASKFASMFHLLNEYEFRDSKRIAVIVAQAKQCGEKCIVEQRRCFEAIYFLCMRKSFPEFSQTCCTILDLFTNSTSISIGDYLRHSRWKMLSKIRPLDAFQENVLIELAEHLTMLVQNYHIATLDLASRTLCRFIVHFYRCMSLYMFLLKEQEKEMRAKHLKLVLDQRRKGLKEMSIVPLFDPNFASLKSDIVEGGHEFMFCINADEGKQFDELSAKPNISCCFCAWSRYISFKRLSVSAIVHSLLKLLLKFCKRWAFHLSKSKIVARLWRKMCNFLLIRSEQDRVSTEYFVKTQNCMCIRVLQRWKQLRIISKQVAKNRTKKMVGILLNWRQVTKLYKKGLVASRKMLKRRTLNCWRERATSKLEFTKLLDVLSAQLSAKRGYRELKLCFEGWKRWYLARWIASTYLSKTRATRALNAWVQYQISFIQKRIKIALVLKQNRDGYCVAAHFLQWKLRAASKRNIKVLVVISAVRIRLRIWNRKCGFGFFKTGPDMTLAIFCFNRWNKLSKALHMGRQELLRSSVSSLMKELCKTHFRAWQNMLRIHKNLQRIRVCIYRSKHAAFSAWKGLAFAKFRFIFVLKRKMFHYWMKSVVRSRKSSLFVYKRQYFFIKRLFSIFKLRCKESRESRGAEFKLRELAKKVQCARKIITRNQVEKSRDAWKHDEGTLEILNGCFGKWHAVLKEHHKMYFLEMMFRCGEMSVMRWHFNQWKRHQ